MVNEKVVIQKSLVRCKVVPDTKSESLQPIIRSNVKENSVVVSDEWFAYNGLGNKYDHRVIDHRAKVYVSANGDTTNALEGFWTGLIRSYIGIYHHVSRKHLQFYVNEVAFRYNTREMSEGGRLSLSLTMTEGMLKYKQLIAKA